MDPKFSSKRLYMICQIWTNIQFRNNGFGPFSITLKFSRLVVPLTSVHASFTECCREFVRPLCILLTKSIEQETFPSRWADANILPIPKRGYNNYLLTITMCHCPCFVWKDAGQVPVRQLPGSPSTESFWKTARLRPPPVVSFECGYSSKDDVRINIFWLPNKHNRPRILLRIPEYKSQNLFCTIVFA